MGMDKAISSGKERRKPYRGSAVVDPSCRKHNGSCPWCEQNRTYQHKKEQERANVPDSEQELGD